MKIVMINGQNHKGSTYHIGKMLADQIDGETEEYFLPKDFGEFCVGCTNCFMKNEKMCPHYTKLEKINESIKNADLLILTSPVYVFHATGAMKAWLDHYGYQWMVHRPKEEMFHKQAVCIATAAGGGMKSTIKDMADSMFFWGIPKIYKYGIAVRAVSFDEISKKRKKKIKKDMSKMAQEIKNTYGKETPGIKTKAFFTLMSLLQRKGFCKEDADYWKKQGWTKGKRPWK